MTRSIWHYKKFELGEIIIFQGKRYKVIQQGDKANSACFKNVYYTTIADMKPYDSLMEVNNVRTI